MIMKLFIKACIPKTASWMLFLRTQTVFFSTSDRTKYSSKEKSFCLKCCAVYSVPHAQSIQWIDFLLLHKFFSIFANYEIFNWFALFQYLFCLLLKNLLQNAENDFKLCIIFRKVNALFIQANISIWIIELNWNRIKLREKSYLLLNTKSFLIIFLNNFYFIAIAMWIVKI